MKFFKNNRGFSLIEVLVFASILSLFFIAAATVATASLKNMKANENKILATRYGEELVEWLRGEKEADWDYFSSAIASCPDITVKDTYCFNTLDFNTTGNCGSSYALYSRFKRYAIFQCTPVTNDTGVEVNIVVEWQDGGQTFQVPVNTIFSRLE